jgi:hypothetical protein
MPKVSNSSVNKGKGQARLSHWVGPHQHVADGIASDPEKANIPAGELRTTQHREESSEIRVKK